MQHRPGIGAEIPAGRLAHEVHVACEANLWTTINDRLKAQAPDEACTFVLTESSKGNTRLTVLLREPVWPVAGEVSSTPHSLEIHADYISRAMDAAIDAGESTGIALIHTHPRTEYGDGKAFFSPRDDWYEQRLFPTLMVGRPNAIFASIVLGTAPHDVDGRIWWNARPRNLSQPVQILRVVGPTMSFLETPTSTWSDHPDPDVMDRSTRLWGKEGRRRLQNLRVGVVGAGGTGSITLVSLATMGVGSLLALDRDLVNKENRHRMLGLGGAPDGQKKVEALADTCRRVATASPFIIDPLDDWGTTASGLMRLKDCDLVFSCVDKFAPRVPLNDFAYAHLVPIIDMASWIHADAHGAVDALMTHAGAWTPGLPCAWCRQTLTSYRLMREAQGDQRGIEDRVAYGLTPAQTDGVEPSVLPLNMAGVAIALLEFMQIAMAITARTPNDLKLILPEWELDECDLTSMAGCATELAMSRGDSAQISPVGDA